jgi:hypothetical protein
MCYQSYSQSSILLPKLGHYRDNQYRRNGECAGQFAYAMSGIDPNEVYATAGIEA